MRTLGWGWETTPARFVSIPVSFLVRKVMHMKRSMISLSRKDLVSLIKAGDPVAIAEGHARNESRARKGKTLIGAYGAPAPAPAPAPATEPDIAGMIARAVAAALAAHTGAPAPAPAPEPETHTDDVAVWEKCIEESSGSRWEAYDRMESIIGKRQRRRIAAAAGVTVGSVANAISKHRKGVKPDLSFIGK